MAVRCAGTAPPDPLTGYIKRMDAFAERRAGPVAGQWWDGLDAATPGPVDMIADESPFPPIGEYGFLSDCETTALIAPGGNVEWLCLPRLDSPSVFGAMLDRSAGGFRLGPEGVNVPSARRYLPGTMVLETSWGTPTGWLVVRDGSTGWPGAASRTIRGAGTCSAAR
jgi:hypothetical protein